MELTICRLLQGYPAFSVTPTQSLLFVITVSLTLNFQLNHLGKYALTPAQLSFDNTQIQKYIANILSCGY